MLILTTEFLPGKYEPPAFRTEAGAQGRKSGSRVGQGTGRAHTAGQYDAGRDDRSIGGGFGDQDSSAFLKLQLERAGVQIVVDPERLQSAIKAARS